MAAGIVGDDGVIDAMAAELEGGERGALVARPCFIDPDMEFDAGIMRLVDRRQRGTPIDTGEPARIAMGQNVEGFARLFLRRRVPNDFETMLADGLADFDILVGNARGLGPGQVCALFARLIAQHIAHALERPAQIDGGGTGFGQFVMGAIKCLVGGILFHRQCHAIRGGGADQRRAAHQHGLDGMGGLLQRGQFYRGEFMRQPRLIDNLDGLGAAGPDGAIRDAFNLHISRSSFLCTAFLVPRSYAGALSLDKKS